MKIRCETIRAGEASRFGEIVLTPGGARPAPTKRGLAFAQVRSRRTSGWRGANDCISRRRFTAESGDAREFLLDDGGELRHLLFHLDHFLAHIENDFDAGEIDSHVASESQDDVETFEVFVGVEARVALRARRLE